MSSTIRFERVGAHTHIRGLGVVDGKVQFNAQGMVGQVKAREAAYIVVQMIRKGLMAGRAILLAGPPGTGKTAIAVAIARELGRDVPFISMSGSEIYSTELKKTEVLMRAIRKAIGVKIRDMREVIEGEIKKMEIKMSPHPYNPYQQVPQEIKLTLVTTEEERTFTAGTSVALSFIQQGIKEGDVIMIDRETAKVVKLGRSKEVPSPYEIEGETIVERPRGPIIKEKEFVYVMTLHDLDLREARGGSIFGLFFGRGEEEISSETRKSVDEWVRKMVDDGTAEIIPGVLFIDEVHMLDIEAYAFLNRALESEMAPIIIFASNRGIAQIRGTELESPHGIPMDLLDRLLIIPTDPYNKEEMREIIKIRMKEEKLEMDEDAFEYLLDLAVRNSLRYAIMLMGPIKEITLKNRRVKATLEDVKEASKLFIDYKTSSEILKDYEKLFLK
jgi:TBP-interacting protein